MITLYDGNGAFEIGDETIAALQLKWPTKEVAHELLKAHLWLLRHKAKRPTNIWRFIDNWLKKSADSRKPPPVVDAWWKTEQRTLNQGEALGIKPRPGESMAEFKDRVANKMRAAA